MRRAIAGVAAEASLAFGWELDDSPGDDRFSPCYARSIPEKELDVWIRPAVFEVEGPGLSLSWEHYDFPDPQVFRDAFVERLRDYLSWSEVKADAERLRLGLITGLATVEDAVAWADEMIRAAPGPDDALLEIGLAGRRGRKDVIALLGEVPGI